jgi:hypothetical protein
MNVSCTIQMTAGESFGQSADQAAAAVLEALGGDPKDDQCTVTVVSTPEMGSAGSQPGLTEPLVEPEKPKAV